jgi:hypothetical protein
MGLGCNSGWFLTVFSRHRCPCLQVVWEGLLAATTEMNKGEEGLESLLGTARVDNEAHGQAII